MIMPKTVVSAAPQEVVITVPEGAQTGRVAITANGIAGPKMMGKLVGIDTASVDPAATSEQPAATPGTSTEPDAG